MLKKEDFVTAITHNVTTIKKAQAEKAVEAIMDAIYEGLKAHKTVRLPKVGSLSIVKRQPTTYRNPKTRAEIKVGETNRIKFSMSEVIKQDLSPNE